MQIKFSLHCQDSGQMYMNNANNKSVRATINIKTSAVIMYIAKTTKHKNVVNVMLYIPSGNKVLYLK